MLDKENTVLLIIDIQGKLARIVHESESVISNARKLIQGIQILNIPILWMEQTPLAIGPTIEEISELLSTIKPFTKNSFSCCGNQDFMNALTSLSRQQVLLIGIETHVCVNQTAIDLLNEEYDVYVAADAVSSRTPKNRDIGLQKMRDEGVVLTSVETALFELLRVAEGKEFRQILKIIK